MRIHFAWIVLLWIARLAKVNGGFTCPTNWWQHQDRCYAYWSNLVPLTYEAGKSECALVDAQLYVPNSDSEFYAVAVFLTSPKPLLQNYVWIGCDENENDGVFECEDGSQLDTSNAWWKDSEPELGNNERCIDIDLRPKTLLDSTCTDLDIVLCEAPAIPDPTTTIIATQGEETTPLQDTLSTTGANGGDVTTLGLITEMTQTADDDTIITDSTMDTTTASNAIGTTTTTDYITMTSHSDIDTTDSSIENSDSTNDTIDSSIENSDSTNDTTDSSIENSDSTIDTIATSSTGIYVTTLTSSNITGTSAITAPSIVKKAISKSLVKKASLSSAYRRQLGLFSLSKAHDGNPLHGYCLQGHNLQKHKDDLRMSKVRCARFCLALKGCRSFNLKDDVCILNSHQKDEVMSSYFVSSPDCNYYERSF